MEEEDTEEEGRDDEEMKSLDPKENFSKRNCISSKFNKNQINNNSSPPNTF